MVVKMKLEEVLKTGKVTTVAEAKTFTDAATFVKGDNNTGDFRVALPAGFAEIYGKQVDENGEFVFKADFPQEIRFYGKDMEECSYEVASNPVRYAQEKGCGYYPDLSSGDIVELNDVWDGEGECPLESGSYSYKIQDDSWINYVFDVVESAENELDTLVKITEIELL